MEPPVLTNKSPAKDGTGGGHGDRSENNPAAAGTDSKRSPRTLRYVRAATDGGIGSAEVTHDAKGNKMRAI